MGKSGQNRTKFQPSSSAQAFGQMQGGFVGFSSGRIPGASLTSMSGDLQLAFKKAGKKDETTKIKGFTELQLLFTTPEVKENIEICLTAWCKLFRSLLLERERRVKETGLKAHAIIMKTAGRNAAPHLKRLIGPWILFLHDASRSCRSEASKALLNAIPEQKHVATWHFCKEEILLYLSDRLNQTKQTLCPPSLASGVEANEIFEENMAASLLGLSFMLKHLSDDANQEVKERYEEIVGKERLWKLANLKSVAVQTAFLNFLEQALSRIPGLVIEKSDKMVHLFIQVLKNKDRGTATMVWKPLLRLFSDYTDRISSISAKICRQLKEQLFAFFRGSCNGAEISYPSLLQLLPLLPTQLTGEDNVKFFDLLLPAVWKGIEAPGGLKLPALQCYCTLLSLFVKEEMAIGEWDNDLPLHSFDHISRAFSAYLTSTTLSNHPEMLHTFAQFISTLQEVGREDASSGKVERTLSQFYTIIRSTLEIKSSKEIETEQADDQREKSILCISSFLRSCEKQANPQLKNLQRTFLQEICQRSLNEKDFLLLSDLTRSISFDRCFEDMQDKEMFFNDILLPLLSTEKGAEPLPYLIPFLSNFLLQVQEKVCFSTIWKSIVSTMGTNRCVQGLYLFLTSNISVDTDLSLWRSDTLNQTIIDLTPSCISPPDDMKSLYRLLGFSAGGCTNTPASSLLSSQTIIKVLEKLVENCKDYGLDSHTAEEFDLLRVQHVAFMIKTITNCMLTRLVPYTESSVGIRMEIMKIFFLLSSDVTYFWKKMTIDFPSFRVTLPPCGESDSALLVAEKLEETSASPIAVAARFAWKTNVSMLQKNISPSDRMKFVSEAITALHVEMKTCDMAWFRPSAYVDQIQLLLNIVEHSSTQLVLDKIILSRYSWAQSRHRYAPANFLDFFKLPLTSFYTIEHPTVDATFIDELQYPRRIAFLIALMKKLSVPVVVGISDYRRIWIMIELFCGYTFCKDLIIPPVSECNEEEEAWAAVSEVLLPFVNTTFSFPESLADPFLKELIQTLFDNTSDQKRTVIELYATSYIISKLLHGNHERSAHFIELYLPNFPADLSSPPNAVIYQSYFLEVLGNLKTSQCNQLGLLEVYQEKIGVLMDKSFTAFDIEVLVHLARESGVLCSDEQYSVFSSLLIFFFEWDQQEMASVQDPLVRIQCLRLLSCAFTSEGVISLIHHQVDMAISFLLRSIPSTFDWSSLEHASLLFYALQLAKLLIQASKDDANGNETTKPLCSWLFSILSTVPSLERKIFTPVQHSICQTLSNTIMAIPLPWKPTFTSEQESLCYSLLSLPHCGIQKAAFHLLLSFIQGGAGTNFPEKMISSLDEIVPLALLGAIDKEISLSIIEEENEIEEIGYPYRPQLIHFVSFALGWTLFCEFYGLRTPANKRMMGSHLRVHVTSLLEILFAYFQKQNPISLPNQSIEIRAFDPLFSDSLDQFFCDLYLMILRTFPSLVRDWWCSDCNRMMTNYVESYTTRCISPTLILQEIEIIQKFEHKYDDFEIKGNSQMKQVQAFYEEDEVQLGICLSIPDSYPLRDVVITSEKKIGVSESQWRQWILSIHTLLHTQDASILDAVLLWKRRMDKLFEGIECCLICYSVFQASNNALPRLACKTCKNKFHSACLYKWFNTSHKSNCPLCQTPWME